MPVNLSTPIVQECLFLNTIHHKDEPGVLGEMSDFRSREGKDQDEPEKTFCITKLVNAQRIKSTY